MGEIQRAGREVERSETLDRIARVGLFTYGVVHLLIGWLAVQLALGDHDEQASATGALHTLARQPLGGTLVWAVGAGMLLLVVWCLIEAAFGARDQEGVKRLRRRLVALGKACVYGAIGGVAVKVALGAGSSRHEEQGLTARLMSFPGGQWIVAVVGVAIGVGGLVLAWRGWTEKFAEHLSADGRLGTSGAVYLVAGRIGYLAKGAAFVVVGGLVCYAGVTHRPQESGGLDEALQKVLHQPFGPVLLVAIGLGFGCYGLFCFARARHLDG